MPSMTRVTYPDGRACRERHDDRRPRAGVVAGFVVLPAVWAILFGVVVIVNLVLMYVGPLARRSPRAGAALRG